MLHSWCDFPIHILAQWACTFIACQATSLHRSTAKETMFTMRHLPPLPRGVICSFGTSCPWYSKRVAQSFPSTEGEASLHWNGSSKAHPGRAQPAGLYYIINTNATNRCGLHTQCVLRLAACANRTQTASPNLAVNSNTATHWQPLKEAVETLSSFCYCCWRACCRWGSARGYRLQHTYSTPQMLPPAETFGNSAGFAWSKYKVSLHTACQLSATAHSAITHDGIMHVP
jgi:hypothetical protein